MSIKKDLLPWELVARLKILRHRKTYAYLGDIMLKKWMLFVSIAFVRVLPEPYGSW